MKNLRSYSKKKTSNFNLKERCETCGSLSSLTHSHFVKENSVHKSHEYDYESPENYFTQCLTCHMNYERLPVRKKLVRSFYLNNRTLTRQEYLMRKGLFDYAERIEYLINDKDEI